MLTCSFPDIEAAAQRIRPHVAITRVHYARTLSKQIGCSLNIKCEQDHPNGAFKIRGVTNFLLSREEECRDKGVITHSSGNHAGALAMLCSQLNIPVTIVMPENCSELKKQKVIEFGITPVLCGPSTAQREATVSQLQQNSGAVLVPPYDDQLIILGQATAGYELLQQIDPPEVLLVPVGGGGLLSGTLLAVKSAWPKTKVIGCEPALADDAYRSLKSGRREQPTRFDSIADGLRTSLGELTFPIIQQLVDEILLCSDEAIIQATQLLTQHEAMRIEPSAAVPLATILEHPDRFHGKQVTMISTGGNVAK